MASSVLHRIMLLWVLSTLFAANLISLDLIAASGPPVDYPLLKFTKEPPRKLEFSNGTGAKIHCSAEGQPEFPLITWEQLDFTTLSNISGLRQVLPDGSLHLLPFRSEDFRQDVHMGVYRCRASTSLGSIISGEVHLRAVMGVEYEARVYDVFAIRGNMAVIRCHIPTMLQSHVFVDAFIRDDTLKITAPVETGGKYFLSSGGVLYIKHVDQTDANRRFRCQTINKLTKEIRMSTDVGKLFVTDPRGKIPPRVVDQTPLIHGVQGRQYLFPCIAQGWPAPTINWSKNTNSGKEPVEFDNIRFKYSSVGMIIGNVQSSDEGIYTCTASNDFGTDSAETSLEVSAPLKVKIIPDHIEIDFAKPALKLECSVDGFPVKNIWWVKNGHILQTKLETKILVKNVSNADDKGVYQCFAKNENDMVQDSAAVYLGKYQPVFLNTFRQTTLHPGFLVSLECEASGNPIPNINWYLDGIHLTSNERIVIDDSVTGNGHSSGILKIQHLKVEDGGLYMCSATNDAGEARHQERLNIYGPLGFRTVPDVVAVVGHNAYLNCPYYGYPVKKIEWKRGDKMLPASLHQAMFSNWTLFLRNVHRTMDSGEYSCITTDNYGNSVDSIIRLSVMVMPKIMPFSFQEDLLREGMRAQLQCVVTEGDPPISISWVKDGIAIPNDLDVSLRDVDQVASILAIRTITPRHNGNYTCMARNAIGTASHTARLAVNVLPKITPFVFQDDQNFKGMRAHIVCAVSRGDIPLHFQWLKDSKDLAQSHSSLNINIASVDKYSSSLSIESVSSKHSANYTCRVSNGAGEASHTAQLLVQVSPRIVPFSFQSDQMLEGALARTTCVVYQGDLPLEISWLKDNKPIWDEFIEIRIVDEYTSILTISKVQSRHSGFYTCIAKNSASSATHRAELGVKVPPKIVAFSFQDDELVEGMYTRVSCVVSRGDLPIHIWWTKNGRSLSSDSNMHISVKKMDEYTSVLSIDSLSPQHNGNYSCYAKNDADATSYTTKLVVNVPPSWITAPNDMVTVVDGGSVTLNCLSTGFPSPVVSWLRRKSQYSTEMQELASNEQYNIFPNGTLHITQTTEDTDGAYYCSASNGVGRALDHSILVHVKRAAKIVSPSGNHTVRKGEDAILICEAKGNLPLVFTWKANGKNITVPKFNRYSSKQQTTNSKTVSELKIEKSSKADSIPFTCIAQNEFGMDETSIWLIVQGRPDAPHRVKAVERKNRSVEVTWQIPFDGNSPVIRFVVEYNEKGGIPKSQTVSGGSSGLILRDLKPSTSYRISVAAENDIGRSEAEGVAEITTSGETPSVAPENVQVHVINSHSLKVSWQPPPKSTWNDHIRGYYVGYREADSKTAYETKMLEVPEGYEKGLSFTISELGKFTRYAIVVQAFNDYGKGPTSDEILVMTSEEVPKAPPQNISCVATGAQTIIVSWMQVPSQYVSGILRGYRILYWPVDTWDGNSGLRIMNVSTTTNSTLKDLEAYTNFSLQVLAYTMAGDGVPSAPVFCKTFEDVPSSPFEIKIFPASEESVIVVWRQPMKKNGIIIHYTVYVDDNLANQKTRKHIVQANGNFYEVRELQETLYTFSVSASTHIGEGLMSVTSTATPASQHNAVVARCAAFNEVIQHPVGEALELLCPMAGHPIPRRVWFFRGNQIISNDQMKVQMDGSLLIGDVQESFDGNYTCTVENSLGRDQVTYTVFVKVPPPSPSLYSMGATSSSISVRWKLPTNKNYAVQGYRLNYEPEFGDPHFVELQPYQHSHVLTNLQCGAPYKLNIIAKNSIGSSQPSETLMISTAGGVPKVPVMSNLISQSATNVKVNLNAWVTDECSISHFTIEYKKQNARNWISLAQEVDVEKPEININDLEAGTSYNLRMTAHTISTSTVINYDFTTLALNDGRAVDEDLNGNYSLLERINIKIMIIIATCVIVFVIICVFFTCVIVKKSPNRRLCGSGNQEQSASILQRPRSAASSTDPRKSGPPVHPYSGYDDDIEPYAMVKLSDFERNNPAHSSTSRSAPVPPQRNMISNSYDPTAPPLSDSYAVYASAQTKQGTSHDKTFPGRGCQSFPHSGAHKGHAAGPTETTFMFPTMPDGDYDPPPPDFLKLLPVKH